MNFISVNIMEIKTELALQAGGGGGGGGAGPASITHY